MKALSIHPFFALGIVAGDKSIEVRTWKTDYRGEILICSTAKKIKGMIPSHALCTVELYDIVPFTKKMCDDALLDERDFREGLYAWKLRNTRIIKPIPVKGKLSLWNFNNDNLIKYVDVPTDDLDEQDRIFGELWDDIII